MRKYFIFLLLLVLGHSDSLAQSDQLDSSVRKSFIPLPIVFFTPETNWGFGGAAVYSFNHQNDSLGARPSQIQLGLAYTLRDQLLAYLPFQLFLKNGKYKLYGELGYYRYVYEFYGIGNQEEGKNRELFNANYPRLRLNALYQFKKDWFAGIRYWMDDYKIVEVEEDGLLALGEIFGREGGFLSGLGLVLNHDNRDNIFYPSSGSFSELVFFSNNKVLGSDFNFTKLIIDHSRYYSTNWNHIIAMNTYLEFTGGIPPFNQLALLGGPKRMRGFYEGEFRDKHMYIFQAEYRMPLYWRFGLAFFAAYGNVEEDFEFFQNGKGFLSYGAGIRFLLDKKQKLNLRFDIGLGKNTSGFYITVAEAF